MHKCKMKKLVLCYSYSDYECSCDVNIPFLYESAEQFIVDFEDAHKEYMKLEEQYRNYWPNIGGKFDMAEHRRLLDAMSACDNKFSKILPILVSQSSFKDDEYSSGIKIYELEEWFEIFAKKNNGV